MHPAAEREMAYLLDRETSILLIDVPRSASEILPWSFIESCKDGYVTSTKYEPVVKVLEPCHVLVFTNVEPDLSKLSADRWDINRIGEADRQPPEAIVLSD